MECFYGYVKELKDKRAIVKVKINPQCSGCGEKGGCRLFAKKEERDLEVLNLINAQIGDLVAIDFPQKQGLIFLFLFGLPILGIFLGLFFGFFLFKKESYALFLAFLFLFLTLLILKILQKSLLKKEEYLPKIKEIIKEER
jgi:positive regulator of sigma E activity